MPTQQEGNLLKSRKTSPPRRGVETEETRPRSGRIGLGLRKGGNAEKEPFECLCRFGGEIPKNPTRYGNGFVRGVMTTCPPRGDPKERLEVRCLHLPGRGQEKIGRVHFLRAPDHPQGSMKSTKGKNQWGTGPLQIEKPKGATRARTWKHFARRGGLNRWLKALKSALVNASILER